MTYTARQETSFLQKADAFFNAKVAELDDKLQWRTLAFPYQGGRYCTSVKVVLSGERLTQIKIMDQHMNIHNGERWGFLQTYQQTFHNFRLARARVAGCLSESWCVDGKAGFTLTADHLVLTFPKPPPITTNSFCWRLQLDNLITTSLFQCARKVISCNQKALKIDRWDHSKRAGMLPPKGRDCWLEYPWGENG